MEQQKQLGEQHKQIIEFAPKINNITNNNTHIKQNFNTINGNSTYNKLFDK